jgi:hypothetical protein
MESYKYCTHKLRAFTHFISNTKSAFKRKRNRKELQQKETGKKDKERSKENIQGEGKNTLKHNGQA